MALFVTKGKISEMSEIQSGTSQSGYQWQNMTLVLDIPGFQGSIIKQVFRVSGDSVEDVMQFKVGDKVEVSFSLYAREYNGRLYNNVDLVKISAVVAQASAAPQAPASTAQRRSPAPQAQANRNEESLDIADYDDLPFDTEGK